MSLEAPPLHIQKKQCTTHMYICLRLDPRVSHSLPLPNNTQYFEGTYFLKSLNPLPFSLWESYIINGCTVGLQDVFLGGGGTLSVKRELLFF